MLLSFLLLGMDVSASFAQERMIRDISGYPWKLFLDDKATWEDDALVLPPVADLSLLPIHPPTGGWEAFASMPVKQVKLPATVEECFWGWNGQTFGVTGNYVGVSWFTTQLPVSEEWRGKRLTLNFESVRFRAEIYVNRKLCGYDLINSTPFGVDITDYVEYGKENELAIRVTDPNGNFNWKDSQTYTWGKYRTNPSHGFGGITGKVTLVATDKCFIEDVCIRNQPKANEIEVEMEFCNQSDAEVRGGLVLQIRERGGDQKLVYSKEYPTNCLPVGQSMKRHRLVLPKAKLWSVDTPALYDLTVALKNDKVTKRFGFRWFEVRNVGGDKQFYLNGKRMVLRTSISWGFWPDNGIAPTDELARKQVESAKKLGLNMLNFHRNIGQTNVLDAADELGLLYYEEPGGNQYPADLFESTDSVGRMQGEFYFKYRTEKVTRMIKRDRSHPCLVIYNLHNERGAAPQAQDYKQMREAHRMDPTRILTYNSSNGENPLKKPDARFKLHLLPNDTTFYDYGWWDRHHAGGPGVYTDNLYEGRDNYHRFSDHKEEIVYWGEDGAIGTPPRLQLIRDEILKEGKQQGWEAADYLKWHDAYDTFLKNNGFSHAFPTVDALTTAMGNVAYYYQGRVIENIRISNTVDAYAVNGWESMKLENHSGIVDNYRNLKGDAEWIARYNQPLFVAVKVNRKVLSVGDTATVDFYIVNEVNLKGKYNLKATVKDADGKIVGTLSESVQLTGGSTYGECLYEGWKVVAKSRGYSVVEAELTRNDESVAKGDDTLFAVQLDTKGISLRGSVADTTKVLTRFMKTVGLDLPSYTGGTPSGDYLLVGAFEPQQWGSGISELMEWVYNGHTLIIVDNPVRWAEFLADKEVLDYRGMKELGRSWYGGNFFVRKHRLFDGLPVDCAFNWEYQCFSAYNRRRIGIRAMNGETIVGCVSDHKKEVYSALSILPAGRGQVIITMLDIPACIRQATADVRPVDIDGMNESVNLLNRSNKNSTGIVGQQLLLNMLKYAGHLTEDKTLNQ